MSSEQETRADQIGKLVAEIEIEGVETEKKRWVTLLTKAKDAAIKNADYPIAGALRDCRDAGTFQIEVSALELEPVAPPAPMTIETVMVKLRYNIPSTPRFWGEVETWLTRLVQEQARKDADYIREWINPATGRCSALAPMMVDGLLRAAGLK